MDEAVVVTWLVMSMVSLSLQAEGQANVSITRTQDRDRRYVPGELIFQDEFYTFNPELWGHEVTLGGSNWEFQMNINSRENSYVKDGKLFIKPTLTADLLGDDFVFGGQLSFTGPQHEGCSTTINFGCSRSGSYPNIINPAMSARLYTLDTFYFKYGRVEVRAKIPAGDWIWPAIWMMPRFNSYGSGWPRSGEIDIMESRGNRKYFNWEGRNIGTETVSATLHFGPDWQHNGYERTSGSRTSTPDNGFDRDFHVYGVEWTDDHISFSVDSEITRRIDPPAGGFWELGGFGDSIFNPWKAAENPRMAPFDQKFYLILNVAVGGTNGYWPGNEHVTNANGPRPWGNEAASFSFYQARDEWSWTWDGDDSAMQIDYVRVYAV